VDAVQQYRAATVPKTNKLTLLVLNSKYWQIANYKPGIFFDILDQQKFSKKHLLINYLKMAWRNLVTNKVYSGLKILGGITLLPELLKQQTNINANR
jgi:hypothetical protein